MLNQLGQLLLIFEKYNFRKSEVKKECSGAQRKIV
jgi:hypothetical protein